MQEIRDAILGEYEVSNEQSERELLTLLGKLSETGLVQIRDATAASIASRSQEPEGFGFRGYAARTPDLV